MTYALSDALQRAVFGRLSGDPDVQSLVVDQIHDAVPPVAPADAPDLHITLGEERVRDWSSKTHDGAYHDFTVTVHARTEGFARAKEAAGAVCAALLDVPLSLDRGHVVDMRLLLARAERGPADSPRRVALRFRAVLEDTL